MQKVALCLRRWDCYFGGEKEVALARKSLMAKAKGRPKFSTRKYNRCPICGRSRAFLRKFGVCRICFRTLALRGDIPGVIKSSW
jgi:small subunit ribosomal protein S14